MSFVLKTPYQPNNYFQSQNGQGVVLELNAILPTLYGNYVLVKERGSNNYVDGQLIGHDILHHVVYPAKTNRQPDYL